MNEPDRAVTAGEELGEVHGDRSRHGAVCEGVVRPLQPRPGGGTGEGDPGAGMPASELTRPQRVVREEEVLHGMSRPSACPLAVAGAELVHALVMGGLSGLPDRLRQHRGHGPGRHSTTVAGGSRGG